MKNDTDVFSLTLVDLILQLLFIGLLGFAASRTAEKAPKILPQAVSRRLDSLAKAQGYSNVAELTDQLTLLAPIRQLAASDSFVAANGGAQSLKDVVDKSRRALGAPPCIPYTVNGRTVNVPVAEITAWDDSVLVQSIGDSLQRILRSNGGGMPQSSVLRLRDFVRTFGVLARGECRYQVRLRELTKMVYARDTVSRVFAVKR